MRGEEKVGHTSQPFGGGCWCAALPPLPRSGIAAVLDVAHLLRVKLFLQSADELEALILADLRLEAMGYSPLTGEKLAPDEPASIARWWNIENLRHASKRNDRNSVACEVGPALESALEEEWSPRASGRVEGRLIALVSVLPPSCLARAKASLALGLSYLRGDERSHDEKVTAISRSSAMSADDVIVSHLRFTRARQLRHSRKALHAATQELRLAEMLLFEATCVLEQHTTTEPVLFPELCRGVPLPTQISHRWICRSMHIGTKVHWTRYHRRHGMIRLQPHILFLHVLWDTRHLERLRTRLSDVRNTHMQF